MDTFNMIALIVIVILFLVIYFKVIRKPGGNGQLFIYGSDLFFDRYYYDYIVEGKKRLNELPLWNILNEFDVDVWKAISAHETGYLSSPAAYNFVVNHNNIFGIEDYQNPGKARHFINVNACTVFLNALMHNERYRPAYEVRTEPIEFIKKLRECGYNSSLSWQQSVIQIYCTW